MESEVQSESFWNSRYENDETGWDIHQVSPPLSAYIDSLANHDLRILIPGCGNAHEAAYLIEKGFGNVTLIDISSVLVNRLKEKFSGESIQIINGDFFNHSGKYDLILEQTFFCAISPSRRNDYVKHASELLTEGGKIAGVMFNENFGFDEHPPFKGSKPEYMDLFSPYFEILQMLPCENSIAPRLGNELFVEFRKRKED